jgi:hypothetical protein
MIERGKKAEALADLRKALALDPSLKSDYEPWLKEAMKK